MVKYNKYVKMYQFTNEMMIVGTNNNIYFFR